MLLTDRKLVERPVRVGRETDGINRRIDAVEAASPRRQRKAAESDDFPRQERPADAAALREESDAAGSGSSGHRREISAIDRHDAGLQSLEAGENPKQGGLSGGVGPDHRGHDARLNVDTRVLERRHRPESNRRGLESHGHETPPLRSRSHRNAGPPTSEVTTPTGSRPPPRSTS